MTNKTLEFKKNWKKFKEVCFQRRHVKINHQENEKKKVDSSKE